jgi:hypothetical protein
VSKSSFFTLETFDERPNIWMKSWSRQEFYQTTINLNKTQFNTSFFCLFTSSYKLFRHFSAVFYLYIFCFDFFYTIQIFIINGCIRQCW